jgi:hypothetical protein
MQHRHEQSGRRRRCGRAGEQTVRKRQGCQLAGAIIHALRAGDKHNDKMGLHYPIRNNKEMCSGQKYSKSCLPVYFVLSKYNEFNTLT